MGQRRKGPDATLAAQELRNPRTRDLLAGSGVILEPRGEHELKGLSGARSIFALQR